MTDLGLAGAVRTARAIREGAVSSGEVVEVLLARIARYNPVLNALVTLDAAGARERAALADAA